MVIALPFLIALIGLLIYLAAANSKAAECGRLAFAIGLLAGLLKIGAAAVSILR